MRGAAGGLHRAGEEPFAGVVEELHDEGSLEGARGTREREGALQGGAHARALHVDRGLECAPVSARLPLAQRDAAELLKGFALDGEADRLNAGDGGEGVDELRRAGFERGGAAVCGERRGEVDGGDAAVDPDAAQGGARGSAELRPALRSAAVGPWHSAVIAAVATAEVAGTERSESPSFPPRMKKTGTRIVRAGELEEAEGEAAGVFEAATEACGELVGSGVEDGLSERSPQPARQAAAMMSAKAAISSATRALLVLRRAVMVLPLGSWCAGDVVGESAEHRPGEHLDVGGPRGQLGVCRVG